MLPSSSFGSRRRRTRTLYEAGPEPTPQKGGRSRRNKPPVDYCLLQETIGDECLEPARVAPPDAQSGLAPLVRNESDDERSCHQAKGHDDEDASASGAVARTEPEFVPASPVRGAVRRAAPMHDGEESEGIPPSGHVTPRPKNTSPCRTGENSAAWPTREKSTKETRDADDLFSDALASTPRPFEVDEMQDAAKVDTGIPTISVDGAADMSESDANYMGAAPPSVAYDTSDWSEEAVKSFTNPITSPSLDDLIDLARPTWQPSDPLSHSQPWPPPSHEPSTIDDGGAQVTLPNKTLEPTATLVASQEPDRRSTSRIRSSLDPINPTRPRTPQNSSGRRRYVNEAYQAHVEQYMRGGKWLAPYVSGHVVYPSTHATKIAHPTTPARNRKYILPHELTLTTLSPVPQAMTVAQETESLTQARAPLSQLDEDDDDDEDEAAETVPAKVPQKQYGFAALPEASELEATLKDYQHMDEHKLYETCAHMAACMAAWQEEYKLLKKIVDDEENAKRRVAHDKAYAQWESNLKLDAPPQWRRSFEEPVRGPAPFEIKGIRAPKSYVDDRLLEHQKQEDRIMCQTYGFKYNPHITAVGRQVPEEHHGATLWNKQDRAGDLAGENVIQGKRTRRPRVLESKDPSRTSTPIPAPARRRRVHAHETGSTDQPHEENGAAFRTRGTATVRGHACAAAAAADDDDDDDDDENGPDSPRKRARGAVNSQQPASSSIEKEVQNDEVAEPTYKRPRGAQKEANGASPNDMLPNASSQQWQPGETAADRPCSSSSSASQGPAEPTYSLREKRKRNFAAENDPSIESRARKRTRAVKSRTDAAASAPSWPTTCPAGLLAKTPGSALMAPSAGQGSWMSTFPSTGLTKARTANSDVAAATSAKPAGKNLATWAIYNGAEMHDKPEPTKPYSEMSKSEKMSWAMKKRWQAGAMRGAVEKRKSTLAKKAEAKAAGNAPEDTRLHKAGNHRSKTPSFLANGPATPIPPPILPVTYRDTSPSPLPGASGLSQQHGTLLVQTQFLQGHHMQNPPPLPPIKSTPPDSYPLLWSPHS